MGLKIPGWKLGSKKVHSSSPSPVRLHYITCSQEPDNSIRTRFMYEKGGVEGLIQANGPDQDDLVVEYYPVEPAARQLWLYPCNAFSNPPRPAVSVLILIVDLTVRFDEDTLSALLTDSQEFFKFTLVVGDDRDGRDIAENKLKQVRKIATEFEKEFVRVSSGTGNNIELIHEISWRGLNHDQHS